MATIELAISRAIRIIVFQSHKAYPAKARTEPKQWPTDVSFSPSRIELATCPNFNSCSTRLTCTAVNDARAMRVAEVMNDFQSLQHRISQYQSVIANEHSQEVGFSILRRCHADAQAVLAQPFDGSALEAPSSTGEQTKRQLRRSVFWNSFGMSAKS